MDIINYDMFEEFIDFSNNDDYFNYLNKKILECTDEELDELIKNIINENENE